MRSSLAMMLLSSSQKLVVCDHSSLSCNAFIILVLLSSFKLLPCSLVVLTNI